VDDTEEEAAGVEEVDGAAGVERRSGSSSTAAVWSEVSDHCTSPSFFRFTRGTLLSTLRLSIPG
jgi:hypothetical protein